VIDEENQVPARGGEDLDCRSEGASGTRSGGQPPPGHAERLARVESRSRARQGSTARLECERADGSRYLTVLLLYCASIKHRLAPVRSDRARHAEATPDDPEPRTTRMCRRAHGSPHTAASTAPPTARAAPGQHAVANSVAARPAHPSARSSRHGTRLHHPALPDPQVNAPGPCQLPCTPHPDQSRIRHPPRVPRVRKWSTRDRGLLAPARPSSAPLRPGTGIALRRLAHQRLRRRARSLMSGGACSSDECRTSPIDHSTGKPSRQAVRRLLRCRRYTPSRPTRR